MVSVQVEDKKGGNGKDKTFDLVNVELHVAMGLLGRNIRKVI